MNIGVEQPSTIKDKIRDLEAQVCWDLIRQQIWNLLFLIMFLVGWDTCKFENGKSVGLRRTVRRRGHATIRTCSIIGHFGHDKEQRRRFDSWTSKNNSRKIIENRFVEGEIKTGSFQGQFKNKIRYFCLQVDWILFQNQLVGLDAEIREETLRLNAERDEQILALQREEKMLQQPKFQRKAPSYCTGPR